MFNKTKCIDTYRPLSPSQQLPVTNGSTYDPEHVIKADGHSRDSKAVILFSYMRSGSSFVGNALFNMDPNAYYAFEPLASLYGGMYGLDMFSVVDTDLIFWANGTIRYVTLLPSLLSDMIPMGIPLCYIYLEMYV